MIRQLGMLPCSGAPDGKGGVSPRSVKYPFASSVEAERSAAVNCTIRFDAHVVTEGNMSLTGLAAYRAPDA